jgi:regulator of replication initiation timing
MSCNGKIKEVMYQAWQARGELDAVRIKELEAKVTELDGQLGSRNLNKEAEYLTKLAQLQLENQKLRAKTQEPVGYVDEFGNFEFTMQMWMEEEPNVTWTPVYTTPPSEWQSLSDEEIEELYGDCSIEYFRDIEAKLKEKNG